MKLIDTVRNDLKNAMKAKNKDVTSLLRMLLSTLETRKIELKMSDVSEFTDEEVQDSITKYIKLLDQEIEGLVKAGRETTKQENDKQFLLLYLPEQMSKSDIYNFIHDHVEINKLIESGQLHRGKMIGVLAKDLKGKADMSLVSEVIGEYLDIVGGSK